MEDNTVLPGFFDKNHALNAFALGLIYYNNYTINQRVNNRDIVEKIEAAIYSHLITDNEAPNLPSYKATIRSQRDLARYLSQYLHDELRNQSSLDNSVFFNELYQPFEHAFLIYCADKNKFIFNKALIPNLVSNRYLKSPSEFRKYVDFFGNKFNPSTFETIYTSDPRNHNLEIKDNLQAEELQTNDSLKKQWIYIRKKIYVKAVIDYEIPISDMELALLAEQLGLYLAIEVPEQDLYQFIPANSRVPLNFILVKDEYNHWGFRIGSNKRCADANQKFLSHYYFTLMLGYQFLDKIFDDGIFCTHKIEDDLFQNSAYVTHHNKKLFFEEFRKYFTDKSSQLYGWRGLRNWIARKDKEIRNNKKANGLDHTAEEFQIILKILMENQRNLASLFNFIQKTSISKFNFIEQLEKKYSNRPKWEKKALKRYNKITLKTDKQLSNFLKIDDDAFKKLRTECRTLFTQLTKSCFSYYTQSNLVIERNRYAQYLEQCSNSNYFIINFNRNLYDQLFNRSIVGKNFTFKNFLLWNWIPIVIQDAKHFGNMARNYFFICCNRKKRHRKTQFDRDTFKGISYRNFSYIYGVFFWSLIIIFGCLAAIISTGFTADEDSPAFKITNSIATATLTIATLFFGRAIISWGWKIPHDLYHDDYEKTRYRDNFGQIIYRLKLINLLEMLEIKITDELITEIKGTISEEFLCDKIKTKLEEKFYHPDNLYKIENAISKQINTMSITGIGTAMFQNLLDNSGANLQQARIRESYIKRFLGEEIKDAIKDHTCYQIKRNYGFFSPDNKELSAEKCEHICFETKKEQPLMPDDNCYSFNDIKNVLK